MTENFSPLPIEQTVDLEQYRNIIDRYYTPMYAVDVSGQHDDYCILFHSNKLCLLTLAPSHPIVRSKKQISKLDFQISKNVNRLENKLSGKGKHGAQMLQKMSTICFVTCSDDSTYTICANVPGKLLEINERLNENPQLLVTEPLGKGYIAVISPSLSLRCRIKEELLSPEQYRSKISG